MLSPLAVALAPSARDLVDVERLAQVAAAVPGLTRATLYGSTVLGPWDPETSDVDVLVEGAQDVAQLFAAGASGNGVPIGIVVDARHVDDLTFWHVRDIRRMGMVLYDGTGKR